MNSPCRAAGATAVDGGRKILQPPPCVRIGIGLESKTSIETTRLGRPRAIRGYNERELARESRCIRLLLLLRSYAFVKTLAAAILCLRKDLLPRRIEWL
ncbi:hypothetical protein QE152_g15266 [Popillia japonica]|uniref:Uncharacterized protein n=1 Tax=Popillia japonica TaxID=7064 RepID=A0AAW1L8K1_POPJA